MLQVHGSKVSLVSAKNAGQTIKNCDGLVTNDPKVYLRVSVADCIPLSLYDPVTKSIGLVHAGWRGLAGGVIKNAIVLMEKALFVKPQNLLSEIGPHICPKHYEVRRDVADIFLDYPKSVKKIGGKMFLNLESIARKQLIDCGIKSQNIKVDGRCTYEGTSLPSYRRGDYKKRVHYLLKIPSA